MTTLLLDTVAWDLVLDSSANIALASDPYSLAQDVASAQRTFKGEVYYNQDLGIPYFDDVLGHLPPASLFTQLLQQAALTVPEVVSAVTTISGYNNDKLTGQTIFTDISGANTLVNF